MKRIMLAACLILLALTGCTGKAEAQGSQAIASKTMQTPTLKTRDEKPCLTNIAGGLAGCTADTKTQKRFILVRSVAIPEN